MSGHLHCLLLSAAQNQLEGSRRATRAPGTPDPITGCIGVGGRGWRPLHGHFTGCRNQHLLRETRLASTAAGFLVTLFGTGRTHQSYESRPDHIPSARAHRPMEDHQLLSRSPGPHTGASACLDNPPELARLVVGCLPSESKELSCRLGRSRVVLIGRRDQCQNQA